MQYFCCGGKKDAAKYFESDSTIITGVRSANTSVLLFRVLMPIYWESHALKFTLHALIIFLVIFLEVNVTDPCGWPLIGWMTQVYIFY